tara:strand:- start:1895 stop:3112 length:1218 start_codon:yes stop_codon:yes gene_type:complete
MDQNILRKNLENEIDELKKQNESLRNQIRLNNTEEKQEIEKEISKYTHTVLNKMGDSVFIKDDQSRLIFVNDAFCEIFNLPRHEILGKTLAENVPLEERDSFLKIDKQVLSDGIENINEESLTIEKGLKKTISTRKSRFVNVNGKKFIVGVIRDISESKIAEQLIKDSEIQLRELNNTKDKLLSIIAHDLRSPFNNIMVLTELLSKSIKNSAVTESEEFLGLIKTTTKNSLILLDNLLNWAKSQTGQINYKSEQINLTALCNEVIELSHPIAKTKNITLHSIETENINVCSDEKIVRTILRNLISNGIKYTRPGGDIHISTIKKQDEVEVTVSDNGIGINNEMCNSLFTISTNVSLAGTLKETGSGFGLILCKEFVEKLGGSIWVESEEGKGSNFKFTIPNNYSV